jgi:hypothetical protein
MHIYSFTVTFDGYSNVCVLAISASSLDDAFAILDASGALLEDEKSLLIDGVVQPIQYA